MPTPTDHRDGVPVTERQGLVARYGWRAWAVPVLAVVTVLVMLVIGGPSTSPSEADAPTAATTPIAAAAAPAPAGVPATTPGEVLASTTPANPDQSTVTTPAAALPDGADIVPAGAGTWHVVPGSTPVRGSGPEVFTYTVEVEDGLQPVEDDQAFAATVDAALGDPRSWTGGGRFQLQRVDTGTPSFRVSLTSQLTIRAPHLCGWEIALEASCYNRWADQRVMINDARWIRGATAYAGDLATYRVYAINHEVGHALGHGHQPCRQTGAPAPIMMQQSWGIANNDLNPLNPDLIPADGHACQANPYPFPAASAPAG
jgi:hypothetical protein